MMQERHMRSGNVLHTEIGPGTLTPPRYPDARIALETQHANTVQRRFVIVIDDSPTVCTIVETCLGRAGLEVKRYPDGVEAIRCLAGPERCLPALVILDMTLPKMAGYEVARRFKTNPGLKETVV